MSVKGSQTLAPESDTMVTRVHALTLLVHTFFHKLYILAVIHSCAFLSHALKDQTEMSRYICRQGMHIS